MKSAYKVFLAGLCSLLLLACGGGGSISDDGSGTPPTDKYVAKLELVNSDGQTITDISNAIPGKLNATLTKNGTPFVGRIIFSLEGDGVITPDSGVTNADGKVSIDVLPGNKLGSGRITATYTPASGTAVTSNPIDFSTKGDGGASTGGAQVALVMVSDLEAKTPISTITSLSPGYLIANVTGISKQTIVQFTSTRGELPIDTAVTEQGVAYVQILAGTQPGAGSATATLLTAEKSEPFVFSIGATNVFIGSGAPFQNGIASVDPSVVSAGGTSSVSVSIQDDAGNLFLDPVEVQFTSVCASKANAQAELSSPVIAVNGLATSTYLAKGCEGADTINVSANVGGKSLTAKATVNVLPATVGSIFFVEALPEVIRLKGTGGVEASTVKFQVMDKNNSPVSNQRVNFTLNTDVGDINLAPVFAITNGQGVVQTVVNSGSVSTSVRVTASVDGSSPIISSQSNQLVISTGLPDQDSFSLSALNLSPEGWNYDGVEVDVTARLADAFNNPVPDGTAVSFTTEGGVIGSSCLTVNGACTVKWTSQNPRPTGDTLAIQNKAPSTGAGLGQPYGGRVTILATAIGDESFPDTNTNGRFDASEVANFLNKKDISGNPYDLSEAFVDHNEDRIFNPSVAGGEKGGDAEVFIDFNKSGVYEPADGLYNGSLCQLDVNGSKHAGCAPDNSSLNVRASLVLVMSGSEAMASVPVISDSCVDDKNIVDPCDGLNDNDTIDIIGKSTGGISIIIGDLHNQPLPTGTKVTFSPSAGSLASKGEFTVASSNYNGSTQYTVLIKGADKPDSGSLVIEAMTLKGVLTSIATIPIVIH